MDKRADFTADLSAVTNDVTAEVGQVLEVLRAGKSPRQPVAAVPAELSPSKTRSAPVASRATRLKPTQPPTLRGRENVTLRLTPETNELLSRTALRQKLKVAKPDTRQDIVEAALLDWFRKHGYAREPAPAERTAETAPEGDEAGHPAPPADAEN